MSHVIDYVVKGTYVKSQARDEIGFGDMCCALTTMWTSKTRHAAKLFLT